MGGGFLIGGGLEGLLGTRSGTLSRDASASSAVTITATLLGRGGFFLIGDFARLAAGGFILCRALSVFVDCSSVLTVIDGASSAFSITLLGLAAGRLTVGGLDGRLTGLGGGTDIGSLSTVVCSSDFSLSFSIDRAFGTGGLLMDGGRFGMLTGCSLSLALGGGGLLAGGGLRG